LFLDSTGNNDGYAVFGQVISGMDVVDSIASVATVAVGSFTDLPAQSVLIESVVLASANSRPSAKAGPDQIVNTFQAVYLNASESSARDGGTLTYSWTYLEGPVESKASLYSTNSAEPYFTPDVPGNYIFELSVKSGNASSSTDRIVIEASDLVF
jgi:hypothetical protein